MKKLLLATGLIIAALAPSAHAAPVEVLIVVLDQSGVKSLHKQTVPNGECRKFLSMLRENIRGDKLPTLTLQDPEVTGDVISAHCVLPDGKVETVDLLPPTSYGPRRLKKISGASRRGSLTFCNNFAVYSFSAKT